MCYCGTDIPYDSCCQPLHRYQKKAKTAEQLMRSRYSAFVVADEQYLQFTHHRSTFTADLYANLARSNPKWLRLQVLESQEKGSQAWVSFKAYYLEDGIEKALAEHSRFVRKGGHWQYVDGEFF
ncbi:YchJ family protein [Salinibius halmophilus]|uniref:YchJ family protein n=1 Tax=Salinibius halmophilus TaxID=1853216 RepID=UPI000E672EA0|nr:YchJ family metal-binding protein [Salinibius halmophilus]